LISSSRFFFFFIFTIIILFFFRFHRFCTLGPIIVFLLVFTFFLLFENGWIHFFIVFRLGYNIKLLYKLNFEFNHSKNSIIWWNLVFTISSAFSAFLRHISKTHYFLFSININQGSFISDLSFCDNVNRFTNIVVLITHVYNL
jgi:hypothetical protein